MREPCCFERLHLRAAAGRLRAGAGLHRPGRQTLCCDSTRTGPPPERSAPDGRRMVMADVLSLGKRALPETAQCQRIRIDLLCAGRSGGKSSPCPDSPLVPR